MSSTKLNVHNIYHCCQRMTEPQLQSITYREFCEVWLCGFYMRADRHTLPRIAILCTPTRQLVNLQNWKNHSFSTILSAWKSCSSFYTSHTQHLNGHFSGESVVTWLPLHSFPPPVSRITELSWYGFFYQPRALSVTHCQSTHPSYGKHPLVSSFLVPAPDCCMKGHRHSFMLAVQRQCLSVP